MRRDLRDCQCASVHKRADSTPLAIVELRQPAAVAAAGTGGGEGGTGALADDRTFELGERRGDMEDE
jgi:hypothetical protein